MIEYAAAFLRPRGWKLKQSRYRDGKGNDKINLIAVTPGGEGTPIQAELALCGHTDTVPWDSSWTDATKLVRRNGRLYGRGTCDMKGFIATVFAAVEHLDVSQLAKPLAIVLTADEEVGCVGAKRLLKAELFKARYAIVGEPTSLIPMRAGKGYGLAEIAILGKEAHSAFPEKGASALYPAARLITRVEAIGSRLQKNQNPLFDPPFTTLNVGKITGGRAKNIVPGECRLLFEWRPIPNGTADSVVLEVEKAIQDLRRDYPDREMSVEVRRNEVGFETSAKSGLVRVLEKLSGKEAGSVSFNTEAPQFAKMGAEVAVFGPGNMRVAHRTGEFLEETDFEAAIPMLKKIIGRFCGGIET